MNQDPLVETIPHRPDPDNNQTFTLVVPADVDPMVAKKMLRNALRDPVAVESWRKELIKMGEDSK